MKKSIFTLALMIICAVSAYAQKKYTGIVNDPDHPLLTVWMMATFFITHL